MVVHITVTYYYNLLLELFATSSDQARVSSSPTRLVVSDKLTEANQGVTSEGICTIYNILH